MPDLYCGAAGEGWGRGAESNLERRRHLFELE